MPREATARPMTAAAGRATRRSSATGPSGRAANHGQAASRANDAVATTVCAADESVREGSGRAATARVATPPAASSTRPGRRAGTSAHAVTRWASPVITRAVVMIQRCGVVDAARALIDSVPESKPPGCTAAAHVHPPTSDTTATVALSTAVRGRPTGSGAAAGRAPGSGDAVWPASPRRAQASEVPRRGGVLVGSGMRTSLGRLPGPSRRDRRSRRGGARRHPRRFTPAW